MLIRQEHARDDSVDRRLACTLAGVAGALNAAAFHAFGFFAANMTGNVSAASDHLARGEAASGAFFLTIILVFVLGSVLSTLLIDAGRRRKIAGIYAFSVLGEAIVLTLLGLVTLWFPDAYRGAALILGLSFLMGLQNAMVTRLTNARVRTTHVSGMITDIGIELAELFALACGQGKREDSGQTRSKLQLHAQTVFSFLAGGFIGILVYQRIGDSLFFCIAVLLFGIALNGLARLKVQQDPPVARPP